MSSVSASPPPQAGPSQVKTKAVSSRKRKAGGDGKKGKVFLEDKAGLLSLISNVTTTKSNIVESRLAKQKGKEQSAGSTTPVTGKSRVTEDSRHEGSKSEKRSGSLSTTISHAGPKKEKKELKASEKRRREKERALRDAKDALIAKEKEKKKRKKGTWIAGEAAMESVKPKKRVGFA